MVFCLQHSTTIGGKILNEYLENNKFSLINNKPVVLNSTMRDKNFKIRHIINASNGLFLNKNAIEELYNCRVTAMEYNSIKSAIPAAWKLAVKNCKDLNKISILNHNNIYANIKGKLKPLLEINTKEIYSEFLRPYTTSPTSINTWIEAYPFLETLDWRDIFKLPYLIVREPYLQTLQYKIIHRTFNCNYMLYKWKIVDTPSCDNCQLIDTVEHYFFECVEIRQFWQNVSRWIKCTQDIKYEFTVCEILLGIPQTHDPFFKNMNFIILMGKWFISHKKHQKEHVTLFEFLLHVKNKLEVYNYVYGMIGRSEEFENTYALIYNEL